MQNAGSDDKGRNTERDELLRVCKRDTPIDLQRDLRVATPKHTHFFESAFIKGLTLPPDARNAHTLHVRNLAETSFDKSEIARDVERETERDKAGGEAVA